jgi:predicted molibdopterin-dependent oxidoreductase YjgC
VGISRFADIHLHYYPGTEEILVAGFIAMMLDQNRVDPAFAAQHPKELEALKKALADYDPERVGHATGVHHELLVDVGCLLAREPSLAVLLGLGSLQSGKLGQVLQGLITLLQVRGSFGKPGGGMATLYGNGNSQGAMEMGLCPNVLPGQVVRGSAPGSDADVLRAIEQGKIKGLFLAMEGLEGSCLSAVEPLLGKLDYVVLQDVAAPSKPFGDALLPMASILEKGGSLTNGERLVQQAEPVLDAPGEAQSLLWVLGELAGRMGAKGFDAATLEAGASDAAGKIAPLSSSKPTYVPWQPSMGFEGTEHPDEEYPYALIIKEPVRESYQGPLLAGETRGQFGSNGDLEMNPADAFSTGFRPGDMVKVSTRKGEWTAKLVMNRLLPRKMVFVPGAAAQSHLGNPAGEGRIFAAKVEKG